MARIDAQDRKQQPDARRSEQTGRIVFSDEHPPQRSGAYIIALTHFAVIYQRFARRCRMNCARQHAAQTAGKPLGAMPPR